MGPSYIANTFEGKTGFSPNNIRARSQINKGLTYLNNLSPLGRDTTPTSK